MRPMDSVYLATFQAIPYIAWLQLEYEMWWCCPHCDRAILVLTPTLPWTCEKCGRLMILMETKELPFPFAPIVG